MSTCKARPGSLYPGKLCDCHDCRPRRLRAMKQRTYRGVGVTGRQQARHILDAYVTAGYAPYHIARLCGLHGHNVKRLADNSGQRMAQHTVNQLLTLPMPPPPVYTVGATRRLQALAAMGWGIADLARRTGLPKSTLSETRRGTYALLTRPALLDKIVAVYDELAMIPGPSRRALTTARDCGWVPPLAWDDDEIDDPCARPHHPGVGVGQWNTRLPEPNLLAAMVNDTSAQLVAARYGVDRKTVQVRLRRAGYRAVQVGAYDFRYVKEAA
jgi:hypothetical protein